MMDFHYQRAGTQYLLIASQTSVDEYSAANHMGEPGKLRIGQYRCFGGGDAKECGQVLTRR